MFYCVNLAGGSVTHVLEFWLHVLKVVLVVIIVFGCPHVYCPIPLWTLCVSRKHALVLLHLRLFVVLRLWYRTYSVCRSGFGDFQIVGLLTSLQLPSLVFYDGLTPLNGMRLSGGGDIIEIYILFGIWIIRGKKSWLSRKLLVWNYFYDAFGGKCGTNLIYVGAWVKSVEASSGRCNENSKFAERLYIGFTRRFYWCWQVFGLFGFLFVCLLDVFIVLFSIVGSRDFFALSFEYNTTMGTVR